ncbi:MAG: apolipoprotein A1/A4/E family protein [Oscillochloris sp.]|nr:apolipoprotein A1/A4/E family protein [Oscillochloris sp.]
MTTNNDPHERLSELLRTPTPSSPPSQGRPLADRAAQARDRAQETAEQVRQRAEEAGREATDRASDVRDRVQETADQVRQRAEEAGREATDRVDSAMTSTGDRLHDAARTIRERAPNGQVGEVADKAAAALEHGGDYLRRSDVGDVRSDLETIVRKHPIQSLAVGFGVGFMVARSLRPRRG